MSKTAPLAKLPPGGSYLFMKYDVFIQDAEFFLGIELISFKRIMLARSHSQSRVNLIRLKVEQPQTCIKHTICLRLNLIYYLLDIKYVTLEKIALR